jgi:Do/DeqQ family serine protease
MKRMVWTGVLAVFVGLGILDVRAEKLDPEAEKAALNVALRLQDAFSSVAEKASPAVVVITNKQAQRMPDYSQLPPEFRFFFGVPEPSPRGHQRRHRVPQPVGRGSGVLIRSTGYIVTNYHVIQDYDELEVKLHDGKVFDNASDDRKVDVVGVDQETDLAVLRIGDGKLNDLPYLPLGNSEKVRVGDWAIAVGAPFNLDYSMTVGVVSQIGRHDVRMNTYENYIQTDASINPGNSGGPLLNIRGEVIGINNFIVTGGGMSRGNVGIGFAISSSLVKRVVNDIIDGGEVVRPWLGVSMQALTDELKAQFGVERGVLVSDVVEGDPADEAGLKAGDVILKVGDKEVNEPQDVQFAVLEYDPGDSIPLAVIRDGKQLTISVKAGRRENGSVAAGGEDQLEKLGLGLAEDDRGVVVSGVDPDGAAAVVGLRPGDRILEVNREIVKSIEDVRKALSDTHGGSAVLYVERGGAKFFVPLPVE